MLKFIWSLVAPLLIRNTVMDIKTTAAVTTTKTAVRFTYAAVSAVFVIGPMMVQPDPIIAEERKTQEKETFEASLADYRLQAEKVCGGPVTDAPKAWYDQQLILDQHGNVRLMDALKAHRIVAKDGYVFWPLGYCTEKVSTTCWAGDQKPLTAFLGGVIYDGRKYGSVMAGKALDAMFKGTKNGVDPAKVNAFCI